MKTLIGFALGTLVSWTAVGAASAAGTSVVAPAPLPDPAIEVIVVTAKRTPALPVAPIYEVIVTRKRPTSANEQRTPPATAIEMPKVELAVAEPLVIRL